MYATKSISLLRGSTKTGGFDASLCQAAEFRNWVGRVHSKHVILHASEMPKKLAAYTHASFFELKNDFKL